MFNKKRSLVVFLMVMVMILSQSVVFAEKVDNPVLKIGGLGVGTELELTLKDLKSMPAEAQIEEEYIYNSKSGEKKAQVKGVSLSYVLKEKAGVNIENAEVLFEASDGYGIDPQKLQDILQEDLKYVLAYEVNGEKIDNDDNADNDEIIVYRKVKEAGEFGTVYKLINKITIGKATESIKLPVIDPVIETPDIEGIVFTDITEGYKFAETAIMELSKKGIINGIGGGLYTPEKELTREQFCKIIVESLGYEQSDYTSRFSDVSAKNWSASYIQTAVGSGLFTGYPDGTFMPTKVITRQEMAAVVGRAAVVAEKVKEEKMNKFTMDKSNYLDKDLVPEWAEHEVAWLEGQGAFAGVAEEKFEPTKVLNRAEAAVIVFNTLFKD